MRYLYRVDVITAATRELLEKYGFYWKRKSRKKKKNSERAYNKFVAIPLTYLNSKMCDRSIEHVRIP